MAERHYVVVDGSNLATEGRTTPSLAQLDEAVRAFAAENGDAQIVVVVDASFEHRVDPSERRQLEEAELHGELVSPPAGAIGRGDAFVLRIAERTGAVVLSNDSFQEFHSEHPWLFDPGRLIGGKPVPGVGWIFTPRTPVRGAKSRQTKAKREPAAGTLPARVKAAELAKAAKKVAKAAKKAAKKPAKRASGEPAVVGDVLDRTTGRAVAPAKKARKAAAKKAAKKSTTKKAVAKRGATKKSAAKQAAAKVPAKKAPARKSPGKKVAAKSVAAANGAAGQGATTRATTRRPPRDKQVRRAIDEALAEVLSPPAPEPAGKGKDTKVKGKETKKHRHRSSTGPPPAVNEPVPFINFVAAYPLGSEVEGEVVSYTSHGAMVDVALPDAGGLLHCYIPLTGLGDPPPRKAREVVTKGERRPFVLVSLDPPRRVAELALPGVAAVGASA
ncbi:MAG TPA: hypothetical protein VK277_07070 [Acidimicrobiales bacterium]|nr:hypothetical protein [Acidimicrobiales bacterium]